MEKKTERLLMKLLCSILCLIIAVMSFTVGADWASSTDSAFHKKIVASVDKNKDTVLELTAAATLVSAAVSAIPDDTATPIAEKIADLNDYFLIVLCILFTEKYLLTIIGAAVFRILIPLVCLLGIIYIFRRNERVGRGAMKILLVAAALMAITPLSVSVSDMIYSTYQTSINDILSSAEDLTTETANLGSSDEEGILSIFTSETKNFLIQLRDRASNLMNNFIEAAAVLIVASCIVPILSILLLLWLVKILTGLDLYGTLYPRRPRTKV